MAGAFALSFLIPISDLVPFEILWRLLTGGFAHARASLPYMMPSGPTLAGFAVLLNLSVCALQLLLAKFAKSKQDPGLRWRPRWTLSVVGLVLAAIGTACTTVGLAHHAAWLTREKINYFDSGRGPGSLSKGNCHELVMYLKMYSSDHGGTYPEALDELVAAGTCTPKELAKFRMFYAADGVAVPFTYLRGLTGSGPDDLPLVVSPLPVYKGRYIVGRKDGIVDTVTRDEYEESMARYRKFVGIESVDQNEAPRSSQQNRELTPPASVP